jgi:tellurite resistance protein TehA-like permease
MKSKKESPAKDVPSSRVPLFDKTNLMWMLGGVAIMILGYILMAGGKSDDPNVFNPNEVYSSMRITVAPILILAGLVVLVFSIFRHPKAD